MILSFIYGKYQINDDRSGIIQLNERLLQLCIVGCLYSIRFTKLIYFSQCKIKRNDDIPTINLQILDNNRNFHEAYTFMHRQRHHTWIIQLHHTMKDINMRITIQNNINHRITLYHHPRQSCLFSYFISTKCIVINVPLCLYRKTSHTQKRKIEKGYEKRAKKSITGRAMSLSIRV